MLHIAQNSFLWSNFVTMRKVLIVIGNAGGGHIACARAVESALLKYDKGLDVEIVDLFQFSLFTKGYDFYYYLITRFRFVEKLYNLGYWLINRSKVFSDIVFLFSVLPLYFPTKKYLKEKKPDLVICNNGPTVRAVGMCKKGLNFKYVITVPDLISVNRWWADARADIIFSPTKEADKILRSYCKECNIVSPYYPLRDVPTYSKEDRVKIKREIFKGYGFDVNKKTILITGCGMGTGNIVQGLMRYIRKHDYQFIIMVGRDKVLGRALKLMFKKNPRVAIQGYTTAILDFFAASDVIIAKPGPATILEVEKVGKKAIFTYPVGYQEWGNVDYLLKNPNFRYVGKRFDLIPEHIEELLTIKTKKHQSLIKDSSAIVGYLFKQK